MFDGRDYLMGISIAYYVDDEIVADYLPFRHPDVNWDRDVLANIKELIESHECLVFHNARYDIASLATIGIKVTKFFYDTMIMAHLIDENRPYAGKKLDALAAWYLRDKNGKGMSPELKFFIDQFGWAAVPSWLMYKYARQDAVTTLRLVTVLWNRMETELSSRDEMWNHKLRLMLVLNEMKYNGINVSVPRIEWLIDEGERAMAEAQEALGGMNPASPKQLQKFLHDDLGIPVLHWTKPAKGKDPSTHIPKPSFTKDALADYEKLLEEMYPGDTKVQNVLKYRGWQKSLGFLRGWLDLRSPDGRLRPDFQMHKDPEEGGTVTGRLSCRNPNLQQIPKQGKQPWNDRLKQCFTPSPGYVLVEADYSQLELRLGTAYAKENTLLKVFQENRDIFDEMSETLGHPRHAVKTFVYATQYGAGDKRIAASIGIPVSAAKRLRNDYLSMYPGFAAFGEQCGARVRSYGKVRLWSGRFRHFLDRENDHRKAMNSVVQGGAADIVERVMVKCWEDFAKENDDCRMLLQIHDAIVFEVRKDLLDEYLPKIRKSMESINTSIMDFKVPFAVDAHILGTKEKLW